MFVVVPVLVFASAFLLVFLFVVLFVVLFVLAFMSMCMNGHICVLVCTCILLVLTPVHVFQAQPRSEVVPHFGADPRWQTDHLLNSEGILAAKKILCLVSQQFPSLDSCPALPDTSSVLLSDGCGRESVCVHVHVRLYGHVDVHVCLRCSHGGIGCAPPVCGGGDSF